MKQSWEKELDKHEWDGGKFTMTHVQLNNLLAECEKQAHNLAIDAALEIAQRYQYSDAHNIEIDEIEALRK